MFKHLLTLVILVLFLNSCASSSVLNSNSRIPAQTASPSVCIETLSGIINGIIDQNNAKLLSGRASLDRYYNNIENALNASEEILYPASQSEIKILKSAKESLAARIAMIRRSTSSIDISYYIFEQDETGNLILNELMMAVKRGVHVRVIVDSGPTLAISPFANQYKALMAMRGPVLHDFEGNIIKDNRGNPVQAKAEVMVFNSIFNPRVMFKNFYQRVLNIFRTDADQIPISHSTFNRRSHDKILLVDTGTSESFALIGGRNIANWYSGLKSIASGSVYEDMDILIKSDKDIAKNAGGFGEILSSYYERIFYHAGNNNLMNAFLKLRKSSLEIEAKRIEETAIRTIFEDKELSEMINNFSDESFFTEGFEISTTRLINEIQNVHSPLGRSVDYDTFYNKNPNSIINAFKKAIDNSQDQIEISSPYLYLSPQDLMQLKKWLKSAPHRKVKILTSSRATSDMIYSQALIENELLPSLKKIIDDPEIGPQRLQVYLYGKADDVKLGGENNYGKLHAKFIVYDQRQAIITTSNLDHRSRSLNSEVGVLIGDLDKPSHTVAELSEHFDHLAINKSTQYLSEDWNKIDNHINLKWKKLIEKFMYTLIKGLRVDRSI
jgi:putative cardiolipin synthase